MLPKCQPHNCKKTSSVLVGIILFAISVMSPAESENKSSAEVKAAYIFNFVKLVDWPETEPPESELPFRFCVLGNDDFIYKELKKLSNRNIHNQPSVIFQFYSFQPIKACNALFISHSEKQILSSIFEQTRGLPILTISDIPDFTQSAGMLELKEENDHIVFLVNPQCVAQSGLVISSSLLALAQNRPVPTEGECR